MDLGGHVPCPVATASPTGDGEPIMTHRPLPEKHGEVCSRERTVLTARPARRRRRRARRCPRRACPNIPASEHHMTHSKLHAGTGVCEKKKAPWPPDHADHTAACRIRAPPPVGVAGLPTTSGPRSQVCEKKSPRPFRVLSPRPPQPQSCRVQQRPRGSIVSIEQSGERGSEAFFRRPRTQRGLVSHRAQSGCCSRSVPNGVHLGPGPTPQPCRCIAPPPATCHGPALVRARVGYGAPVRRQTHASGGDLVCHRQGPEEGAH